MVDKVLALKTNNGCGRTMAKIVILTHASESCKVIVKKDKRQDTHAAVKRQVLKSLTSTSNCDEDIVRVVFCQGISFLVLALKTNNSCGRTFRR
jgi:uncharacterized protein Veg